MLIELPFLGDSMHPFLVTGDRLVVNTYSKTLEPYRVYVFKNDLYEMISHRVVDKESLAVKGDRSLSFDDIIDWEIEGEVIAVLRNKKKYYLNNDSKMIKYISYLSRKNHQEQPLRFFFLLGLVICSKLYFLFLKKAI